MFRGLWLAVVLTPVWATSAMAGCPIEKTHYDLMSDPAYHVDFAVKTVVKSPSPDARETLFLRLSLDKTKQDWWFFFDGGSSGIVYLISTMDVTKPGWIAPDPDGPTGRPLSASPTYYGLREDLSFYSSNWPQKGSPAPEYIFIPELTGIMWHAGVKPAPSADHAFFKLMRCDA